LKRCEVVVLGDAQLAGKGECLPIVFGGSLPVAAGLVDVAEALKAVASG
jgi:hypothetical protein